MYTLSYNERHPKVCDCYDQEQPSFAPMYTLSNNERHLKLYDCYDQEQPSFAPHVYPF